MTRARHRRALVRVAAFTLGVAALAASFFGTLTSRDAAPVRAEATLAGPEEVVFDWSRDACDRSDVPDMPARALRGRDGRVQLIASHSVVRRFVGRNLGALSRDCRPVMTSDRRPDPHRFDDREWIGSVHTSGGRRVFALVHNEYQGHRHPGRCPSRSYRPCWYNAITLAESRDGGATFSHTQPPGHLVASIPYQYEPDAGPMGLFEPSNIVRNGDDGLYYAAVRAEGYRDQEPGTCVMRTADLADPRGWRAWDGEQFAARFVDPYGSPGADPSDHNCQPVSYDAVGTMSSSLTFNSYFDKFMLVGVASSPEAAGRDRWGVYFSLSDDLVTWSERRPIVERQVRPTYRCGDLDPIAYPALIDPASRSPSFETAGRRAYLYFTRYNHEGCRETLDRDLMRVPVAFSKDPR
jgi:hypothetical protein